MKINFIARCHVPQEQTDRNVAHCKTLGLPATKKGTQTKLAVVGGGGSILERLDELKSWDGDIWACGSAYHWCVEQGLDAVFFCIDPCATIAGFAKGAKKAILASCSHPDVFDELKDADVSVFDLTHTVDLSNHGVTTMTAAPELSLYMGYREVTFFGADSSYLETTHAYSHVPRDCSLTVKVGDQSFETDAELLLQAEFMATMIRLAPNVFKEKSGALLGALVEDLEYDITHISPHISANLTKDTSWQIQNPLA